MYLNHTPTNCVLCNYIVIDKVIKYFFFIHLVNERKLTIHINILADKELRFLC